MTDYPTAIHEAGHAVIGRALGIVCGHVTIEADEESSGHSIIADPWEILDQWWGRGPKVPGTRPHGTMESALRARAMSFMAGREAEVEIIGECQGGDGDDRYQAELMLEQLDIPDQREPGDGALERYEARLRKRCLALVRRHRLKIERVATVPMSRRALSAEEIDALISAGP